MRFPYDESSRASKHNKSGYPCLPDFFKGVEICKGIYYCSILFEY